MRLIAAESAVQGKMKCDMFLCLSDGEAFREDDSGNHCTSLSEISFLCFVQGGYDCSPSFFL